MALVILCTPALSLLLTWIEKYGITWKNLIAPLLNPLKTREKFHFTTLNYTRDYALHPKLWTSVQVKSKHNIEVQSVTRVIV